MYVRRLQNSLKATATSSMSVKGFLEPQVSLLVLSSSSFPRLSHFGCCFWNKGSTKQPLTLLF